MNTQEPNNQKSLDRTVEGDDATDAIAQLLRKAERRPIPSQAATQQAYSVVHAAWTFQQRGKSRIRYAALAAGITAIAVTAIWMFKPQVEMSPIAQVAQLRGEAVRLHNAHESAAIVKDAVLVAGDELVVGQNSRVVLRRASGLSIVLGAKTRVQWQSHDDLRLMAGVLYVDTGVNASSDPFVVSTLAGVIRHVGTQFTVLAHGHEVRIAVRQGSVRVQSSNRLATVMHGEQAVVLNSGEMLRDQVTEANGAWNWLSHDQTQFAIEDRSLFDVLADIGAASGIQINYMTAAMEAQAKELKLHGPALALEPTAALNAVLSTTQLTAQPSAQAVTIIDRLIDR